MYLKKIIKKLLRYKTPDKKEYIYDESEHPKVLNDFYATNKNILNKNGSLEFSINEFAFTKEAEKINRAFKLMYTLNPNKNISHIDLFDGLDNGIPMKYKPFSLCISEVKKELRKKNLFWYPAPSGNVGFRKKIADYLIKEKFVDIDEENVVLAMSTTHAFNLVCNLLIKKGDVVLMTGPNYGLLAVIPERYGGVLEILPLEEGDNYRINTNKLKKRIRTINKQLKEKYYGAEYIPSVKMFLNINPQNPYGTVYSENDKELLSQIGEICLNENVFIIDDLIYRDLSYNRQKLALPIATMKKYADITISLFGLSKSYGLASFRAAFIVAPTIIAKGLTKLNFQQFDSISVLTGAALAGAYNASKKRERVYNRYFRHLMPKYEYNFYLLKAIIYGADKVEKYQKRIKHDLRKYDFNSFPYAKLVMAKLPDSGFYSLVDFTKTRGKKYFDKESNNYVEIKTEFDLYSYLHRNGSIKYIMGIGMAYPSEDKFIARVSFAVSKKALIYNFKVIYDLLRELK